MDAAKRRALIDHYRSGYRAVVESLADATDEELDARPGPGKWSAREIVHHLADSEMTAAIRLRLLIAAPGTAIAGYDQDEFARRLHYDRPIDASLEAFRAARSATVEIVERLTDEEWAREGTHSEIGRYTVDKWLEIYSEHPHQHARQIAVARASAKSR